MNSEVAEKFVDRINAHDVDGLVSLMSADHVFIDSLGDKVARPAIETGWREYFATVPDYWVRIDRVVADEPTLILIGAAGGTYVPNGEEMRPENKWETPAVWRAVIRAGEVSEWQIFADNEPIRAKMRAASRQLESAPRESRDDHMAILRTRLAKGEITEEEFERLTEAVGEREGSSSEATHEAVDWKGLEVEAKKKLDGLTPQMAEERYDYLSRRPISELTDAEYEERLALAEKLSERPGKKSAKKRAG
ncbi:MAG: nuclear transport factor 2 family protein [Nitrososphaerales archaeon]